MSDKMRLDAFVAAGIEAAARIDVLEAALRMIAEIKGKTLISFEYGQPYSIGANRAFEQCADTASAALTPEFSK